MMRSFLILILLIGGLIGVAQTSAQDLPLSKLSEIKTGKDVYLLTYFRQRYPTRIEIDATGKTIEVPLPDPMLEAKLHIALSTDGRNWTPLNDNKPIWQQFMRDPYVRRGPDGLWHLLATGGGGVNDPKQVGPKQHPFSYE